MTPSPEQASGPEADLWGRVAPVVLVLAGLAAYANSFGGVFVFDDEESIVRNVTLRHLGALGQVLRPPPGLTVSGRPLLNLSLALNYAASGLSPWSYHAVNLAIHLLAGLLLFGIIHRTLRSLDLAFAASLLWVVHPLQTESVTYVVQRAESMMGLFYLLTLYLFIRGAVSAGTSIRPRIYLALSVGACLMGMATKEVMVSAPVTVFLYDRTFVAGSFRAAWRARKGYYLALGATWILLVALVVGNGGNRSGTSGFGLQVSYLGYLLTQGPAILGYLRLVVWPHPLDLYPTAHWTRDAGAWISSVVVLGLAATAIWALVRRPKTGFAAFFFFAILAPTSLIPGPAQTMAEHRMYLALAPVLVGLVAMAGRWIGRRALQPVVAAAALALCLLTLARNRLYGSELALWADTAAQSPDNPYALNAYASCLNRAGRAGEARQMLGRVLALKPDYAEAYVNLADAAVAEGRPGEAKADLFRALQLKPTDATAYNNLGNLLRAEGRVAEAMTAFLQAVHLNPNDAPAWNGLGTVLTASGRLDEAMKAFARALEIRPGYAEAAYNYGIALAGEGRLDEAIARYRAAIAINPDLPEAHLNLGAAYAMTRRFHEAEAEFEAVLRLRPDSIPARENLERVRAEETYSHP